MQTNQLIKPNTVITINIEENITKRIDIVLTEKFPLYSRSYFQKLIVDGFLKINDKVATKYNQKIKLNDKIEIQFPAIPEIKALEIPENYDLEIKIIYENESFIIVYKPPYLLTHATSTQKGVITLVDWLIHKFKELKDVGEHDRPGIVHRLDKDTSGIMIIPRNNYTHMIFSEMFKNREITKIYQAIVVGHPPKSGVIEEKIGRHPVYRHKMSVNNLGRDAVTNYQVIEYLKDYSLVEVHPITGRTHQIRVHFASISFPLLGDKVYGTASKLINRQALHAYKLSFMFQGKFYSFTYDMPMDMKILLDK